MEKRVRDRDTKHLSVVLSVVAMSPLLALLAFTPTFGAGFLQLEAAYLNNIENGWAKIERRCARVLCVIARSVHQDLHACARRGDSRSLAENLNRPPHYCHAQRREVTAAQRN